MHVRVGGGAWLGIFSFLAGCFLWWGGLFFLLLDCLYLGLAVSGFLLVGVSSLVVRLEPCLCGPCGARGGAVRAPLGVFRRVAVLCAVCSARCSFFGGVFMCKCKCST